MPPKVNAVAAAAGSPAEEFSMAASFAALSVGAITLEGVASVETMGFGSRAGAGALADPAPNPAEVAGEALKVEAGAGPCECVDEVAVLVVGCVDAAAKVLGAEVGDSGFAVGATSSTIASKTSSSLSVSFEAEAAIIGCGG